MAEVTPVTLVIGAAGAGKTTMLRQAWPQPEAAGIAIVAAQPDPPIWWNAGCACCAPRDDVARALRALLPRVRRDEVRRVVIATSGLADPGPILATLLSDPVAASAYRLDAIVAVMRDAAVLDTPDKAVWQAAMADRIVLTGTDPARLRSALETPGWQSWFDTPAPCDTGPDPRIRSFCLTAERPLSWPAVSAWLQRLVLQHGRALLRMKGILTPAGQHCPLAIHSARHLLFAPLTLPPWPSGDAPHARFAFITNGLQREDLAPGMPGLAA